MSCNFVYQTRSSEGKRLCRNVLCRNVSDMNSFGYDLSNRKVVRCEEVEPALGAPIGSNLRYLVR